MQKDNLNTEVIEDKVEETKEPTTQERIDEVKMYIDELNSYIVFTQEMQEKQVGDTFIVKDLYCKVVKRTPQGHIDSDLYELEGTLEQPKFGKFVKRERTTPDSLNAGKGRAIITIDNLQKRLNELETQLEKEQSEQKEDDVDENS